MTRAEKLGYVAEIMQMIETLHREEPQLAVNMVNWMAEEQSGEDWAGVHKALDRAFDRIEKSVGKGLSGGEGKDQS